MKATITIATGNFERETEKAYLIDFGAGGVWFPKSQMDIWECTDEPEYARHVFIVMPIWLAKAKGIWGYDCFSKPMCATVEDSTNVAAELGDSWVKVDGGIK